VQDVHHVDTFGSLDENTVFFEAHINLKEEFAGERDDEYRKQGQRINSSHLASHT